ncbi:thioredoxin domain-containing protein [Candidatus Carsonella ruddii]|uniref:thioredoxin domain-containing protein n=1 Tax=Carsonella ruddii TaxID=114186 RepID=UPI003D3AD869
MIKIKKKNIYLLNKKKKILFFYSKFNNSCKLIKKTILKIEKKIKILFFSVNIEENLKFCIENNIKQSPTIIFDLKKKKIVTGIKNINEILNFILFKR